MIGANVNVCYSSIAVGEVVKPTCLPPMITVNMLTADAPTIRGHYIVILGDQKMARKGVAILREMALVNGSSVPDAMKTAMLRELHDELAMLYAPYDRQQELSLEKPQAVKALKAG